MKDLILVKTEKNKEERYLRKKFEKDNLSVSPETIDSLTGYDSRNKEFFDLNSRINFLNKLLFNFLVFAVLVLTTFFLIIILSITSKTLEIKNKVLSSGVLGLKSLELAKDSFLKLDAEKSEYYFKLALQHFEEGNLEFSQAKLLTASLSILPVVSNYQQNAKNILDLGESVSEVGIEVTGIFKEISSIGDKEKVSQAIENIKKHSALIKEEIKSIENSLSRINTKFLDKNIALQIENIKKAMPQMKEYLGLTEDLLEKMPEVLGFDKEKNYLLVFQNNNEMRSTGGFIGSFGILKLKDGEIKDFFIDDVYKLDKKYSEAVGKGLTSYLEPPFPMDPKATGNWALRDANLNPDFPKTAETILDFWKKEVQFSENKKYPQEVDGIVSITPTVIEEILSILGPISLDEYGFSLDSGNLLETLQLEIEAGKDKQQGKNPKTILETLKNKLMEKFSSLKGEKAQKIISAIVTKLDEKHILLYSKDKEIENLAKKLKWTGEVKEEEGDDFLMVINNNFGGGKSSLKIDEFIEQEINIKEDGTIVKNVKITREHTSDYYLKYFDPWTKEEKWLVGVNNNYIKVYIPQGSKLIKAEGFENKVDVYNEGEKTAYGSNFTLEPKQKKTVSISYELPFRVKSGKLMKYSLYMQKQAGSLGSKTETRIKLPDRAKVESSNGNINQKDVYFLGIISQDRSFYLTYSLP